MALPARAAAQAAGATRWLAFDARGNHPLSPTAQGYLLKDWVGNFCHSADAALGPRHFPWSTLRDYASGWLNAETAHYRPVDRTEKQRELMGKAASDFGRLLQGGAERLWERMSGPGDFPANHDVYLKLYVMSRPSVEWDYLLLDEAQDANPLALQFFNLAGEQGSQTIAVGDSHQQLYAWRGAVDAMRQIDSHRRLTLTQSFRFGPTVADVANRVLALGGSDFRICGAGGPTSVGETVDAPTAVICRTNGAAISIALELAEEGRNPALCLERAATLSEIDALERFETTGRSSARRYCAFRSFDELRESVEAGEMPDVKILLKLAARHGYDGTRAIISEMAVGKNQAAIDSSGRDVVCLTTHAAKGLEFKRVLLADDFGPKPNEKKGETEAQWLERLAESQDDLNVFYVAVTRAQSALGFGDSPLGRLIAGRPVLDRFERSEEVREDDWNVHADLGRGG
jgi:superfamily I DNA/RNA helicase